jgi:hypothetical protein
MLDNVCYFESAFIKYYNDIIIYNAKRYLTEKRIDFESVDALTDDRVQKTCTIDGDKEACGYIEIKFKTAADKAIFLINYQSGDIKDYISNE